METELLLEAAALAAGDADVVELGPELVAALLALELRRAG